MTISADEFDGIDLNPVSVRASGLTAGQETAEDEARALSDPIDPRQLPEERKRGTTFARLRLDWDPEVAELRGQALAAVNETMDMLFGGAYAFLNDVIDQVTVIENGRTVWRWSLLTRGEREDLILTLTVQLVGWKEKVADLSKGDSMYAKAAWTYRFATSFDNADDVKTVDGKQARANVESAADKHFAIFKGQVAARAEALVGTLELFGQRLKDVLSQ